MAQWPLDGRHTGTGFGSPSQYPCLNFCSERSLSVFMPSGVLSTSLTGACGTECATAQSACVCVSVWLLSLQLEGFIVWRFLSFTVNHVNHDSILFVCVEEQALSSCLWQATISLHVALVWVTYPTVTPAWQSIESCVRSTEYYLLSVCFNNDIKYQA